MKSLLSATAPCSSRNDWWPAGCSSPFARGVHWNKTRQHYLFIFFQLSKRFLGHSNVLIYILGIYIRWFRRTPSELELSKPEKKIKPGTRNIENLFSEPTVGTKNPHSRVDFRNRLSGFRNRLFDFWNGFSEFFRTIFEDHCKSCE